MAQTLTITFGGSVAAPPAAAPAAPPKEPKETKGPPPAAGDGFFAALLPPWLERLRVGIIAAVSGSVDFFSKQVAGSLSALVRDPGGPGGPSRMLGAAENLFARLGKYLAPEEDEKRKKPAAPVPAAALPPPGPPTAAALRQGAGPTLMGQPVYTGAPVGAGPTMMGRPTYGPSTLPGPPTPATAPPSPPKGPTLMGQPTYAPPPPPAAGAAPPAAGGAAAEQGGTSGALAGTVAVVGAITSSAKAAFDAITGLIQSTVARAGELSMYSAPITAAMTQADIREMMSDLKESAQLGDKMAELVTQQSELSKEWREFWLPFKEALTDMLTTLVRWARSGVGALKSLVMWWDGIYRWVVNKFGGTVDDPVVNEMKRQGPMWDNPLLESMLDFMKADPYSWPDTGRPAVGPPGPPGWQAPAPRADQVQGNMAAGGRPPMLDF